LKKNTKKASNNKNYNSASIVKQNLEITALKNPSKLNLLTISWNRAYDWLPEQFVESIKIIPQSYLASVDLIICAGRTVDTSNSVRKHLKKAVRFTKGTPILFEETARLDNGAPRWNILYDRRPELKTIRYEQLITNFDEVSGDTKKSGILNKLRKRIQSGEGTFKFKNSDTLFQVLICGENNVLKTSFASKVAKESNWILINPSHDYYRNGYRTGLLNYNTIKTKKGKFHGNVIGRLVNKRKFQNGTYPPLAIIHVNNFLDSPNYKYTIENSSKVFIKGKKKAVTPNLAYKMVDETMAISRYAIPLER